MRQAIRANADFCDIKHSRNELLAALGKVRQDGQVVLTQEELESGLWSTCVAAEDGKLSLDFELWTHQVLPEGFTVDPYFCFVLERKRYV